MTFGSMWRRMMRACPNPAALAASTYGISRMASALERITSAQRGIMGMVIAAITFSRLLPRMATMASARMIRGNEMKMSMKRCTTRSIHPRRRSRRRSP